MNNDCLHQHSKITTTRYQRSEAGRYTWILKELCTDCRTIVEREGWFYGA
jgi:hypothetical protein